MMKMKRWIRMGSLALGCVLGASLLAACTQNDGKPEDDAALPAAPEGAVIDKEGVNALRAGDYRLDFVEDGGGYIVRLVDASLLGDAQGAAAQSDVLFEASAPAGVTVMVNKTLMSHSAQDVSAKYEQISAQDYGYLCTAIVSTANGSKIAFTDRYYLQGATLALSRRAEVVEVGQGDYGFQTVYSIGSVEAQKDHTQFDYFIPSILYKDSRDMAAGAPGSNLGVAKMYVKETRTGLPLSMLRDKDTGYSVAIAHLEPEIDVNGTLYGGSDGYADNDLQYGSIGYSSEGGMAVDFCYPCAEVPLNNLRIYSEMTKGSSHEYKLSILPDHQDSYAKSMTNTFKAAFVAESPEVATDVDIDAIYDDNIEVFTNTYKEFDVNGSIVEAGVPFSLDLTTPDTYGDWSSSQGYSFQFGFIGQQTSIAFNLLRTGIETKNAVMEDQGRTMLNFWSSSKVMSDNLPPSWWDPNNGSSTIPGTARYYPSFLRCVVDGLEGMLDACVWARNNGVSGYEAWESALLKVGSWLADNQNDDGSYYRAYRTNGTVWQEANDPATYQGDSKLNTPVAIRLLVRLYEYTGEQKYATAAERAAEFSYNNLYLDREKYVGGTPDNPNTVDKEAAIYALYGFDAAYELTGEEKYLDAAEHAAVSALSWVYCYDFAVPGGVNEDINTFHDGGVSGFSLIATGHSGADNYSAVLYYEFFKMYLHTGDTFYRDAAYFLQQNTKLGSDYNGEIGYAFKALCPEATGVADFSLGGSGAKLWLVWCGVVNIQPIGYMRDTFGNADASALSSQSLEQLRTQLDAYGSGGIVNAE